MTDEDGSQAGEHLENAVPHLLMVDDMPVVLDSNVASGFGVATKEVNQAFTRNSPKKFDHRHGFRLTKSQRDFLRSHGVISKPEGRGGSQVPPMVYTQKGVARLATILDAPGALAFTDAMIDLTIEVHRQLAQGVETPRISHPSRYLPVPEEEVGRFRRVRQALLDQLESLMSSRIGDEGPTVREGLSESATSLYDHLQERLRTRSLENEKIATETLQLLEAIETMRQDRKLKKRRADLEDTRLHLQNQREQMQVIREQVELLRELEPPAIARLNQTFLPGAAEALRLPPPTPEETDDA